MIVYKVVRIANSRKLSSAIAEGNLDRTYYSNGKIVPVQDALAFRRKVDAVAWAIRLVANGRSNLIVFRASVTQTYTPREILRIWFANTGSLVHKMEKSDTTFRDIFMGAARQRLNTSLIVRPPCGAIVCQDLTLIKQVWGKPFPIGDTNESI